MTADRIYLKLTTVIVDLQAGMLYRRDGYLLAPGSVEDIGFLLLLRLVVTARGENK